MDDLLALFAICLVVALATFLLRRFARRFAARLEEREPGEVETYKDAPNDVWRELDRQRTRGEIRQHYWR